MLDRHIRPYMRSYVQRFLDRVSVEELIEIRERDEDVYPLWLSTLSEDNERSRTPPWVAYLFQDHLKSVMKETILELSPAHYRVFDANPSWSNRQLDGMFFSVFK